jgi:hypothetical protein
MKNITPIITDDCGRDEKGRFKNGNIGKPLGSTNKNTRDLKDFITSFLNSKTNEIEQIWDILDEKDKATFFLHLSRLVISKPIEEPQIVPSIDLSFLTTDELRELLNETD